MKGIRGENNQKIKKISQNLAQKKEVKLTVSRALSEDLEFKSRSLASIKRARKRIKGIKKSN